MHMNNWNEYLDGLYEIQNRNELRPEGNEMIDLIKTLNIPFNLDVDKCLMNFDVITNYSIFDYREPNYGTESMYKVLTEKKFGMMVPHYSNWFISCFPDVYFWAQPSENSNLESLELIERIIKEQDKFLTEEEKFNPQAYLLLCNLYKKQMLAFETN